MCCIETQYIRMRHETHKLLRLSYHGYRLWPDKTHDRPNARRSERILLLHILSPDYLADVLATSHTRLHELLMDQSYLTDQARYEGWKPYNCYRPLPPGLWRVTWPNASAASLILSFTCAMHGFAMAGAAPWEKRSNQNYKDSILDLGQYMFRIWTSRLVGFKAKGS